MRQACAGSALVAVFGLSAGTGTASHVFAATQNRHQAETASASIAASFFTDSAPSHEQRATAMILAQSKLQATAVIAPSPSRTTSKRARHAVAGSKAVTAAAPATPAAPAAAPAGPVLAPAGNSAGYAFGYCTWWVSHKRFIPWHGLAYQWWSLARAYGFAEGSTPRVGAVMVMAAGVAGASASSGHVAYVEAVNPDGSFLISEMNWYGAGGGWGKVDYRTITSMWGILGFIY